MEGKARSREPPERGCNICLSFCCARSVSILSKHIRQYRIAQRTITCSSTDVLGRDPRDRTQLPCSRLGLQFGVVRPNESLLHPRFDFECGKPGFLEIQLESVRCRRRFLPVIICLGWFVSGQQLARSIDLQLWGSGSIDRFN